MDDKHSPGIHVNKSGRKGDPRMHRAVAARLANSSMSLFEALRAGGFDYSVDDDSQSLDADQVTLAQRKNQLSRRLRTARRDAQSSTGSVDNGSVGYGCGPRGGGGGKKRTNQNLLDDFDEMENSADESNIRVVKAKNHPDYRGPIIVLPARRQNGVSTSYSLDESTPAQVQDETNLGLYPAASLQPQAHTNQFASSLGGIGLASSGGVTSPLPSGVAVASLNSTAQRIGMTLEQLALSLSHCSNLSRVLTAISSDSNEEESRHETLAQNLCLTEIRSLYSRCMLLAGFSLEQANEDSPKCIEFAVKAWQLEGRRLGALIRSKNLKLSPLDTSMESHVRTEGNVHGDDPADELDQKMPAVSNENSHSQPQRHYDDKNDHHHHHEHDHAQGGIRIGSERNHGRSRSHSDCVLCEDGRHIHRLQGCGHKAILHQPENGPAHIDFVVGDKIECYQGLQPPMGPAEQSNLMNIWPSQYKCEDVSCENTTCGANAAPTHQHRDEAASMLPKVLDMSSLDLDGKEWISAVDDTLLSLFKLSDASPGDETIEGGES